MIHSEQMVKRYDQGKTTRFRPFDGRFLDHEIVMAVVENHYKDFTDHIL